MKELWVDKYRPRTIGEYVWQDNSIRDKVQEFVTSGNIPHLLLKGGPGTGKSALVKMLLEQLNINPMDIMTANGSKECRKIEWIDRLIQFCSTMPFGEYKVVYIDEADYMGLHTVQPALRPLMVEIPTVRFILTCNYPNRIIPPIHSRCQSFQLEKFDVVDFTTQAATILIQEDIDFDLDVLDNFIRSSYPDMRKCLNNLQANSISGQLRMSESVDSSQDFRVEMVELFKQGKINQARKLICSQIDPDEVEGIYRWLYDNVDLLGKTADQQDNAVLIIQKAIADHPSFADVEINLAACMIRLARNYEIQN